MCSSIRNLISLYCEIAHYEQFSTYKWHKAGELSFHKFTGSISSTMDICSLGLYWTKRPIYVLHAYRVMATALLELVYLRNY